MTYRPGAVWNGSGWDDIGDKRMLTHDHSGGANGAALGSGSITATQLASNAVEEAKIKDGAVSAAKLKSEALPQIVNVPAIVIPTASTGGRSFSADSTSVFGGYAYGTTFTQNNYLEWSVVLTAGTYTLVTVYAKNSDAGIATIAVNGSNLATTVDGYAATFTRNNLSTITGLTITAGTNTIRYTAATKNASSSNYTWYYHGFALTRTGA